ncbi:MAG: NAD-dependent epimerase/dehydratase family protein [Alphaproteobacteria bacterium]
MLRHLRARPENPERVVILGSGGFVGGAIANRLAAEGRRVLRLGRADFDLLSDRASDRLADCLRDDDSLVMVSALAPCRTPSQLSANIRMAEAVASALERRGVAHVVYISSDAVYADSDRPLSERSCAEPASLHGVMHLAREIVMRVVARETPLAILRPTLIFGSGDPHNGYGPNQFRRLAAKGDPIVLFGEGEELRDHIWIGDVAEIACRVLFHRSAGILNLATGHVVTFLEIAEAVSKQFGSTAPIQRCPRAGPAPHGGYRAFDIAATKAAFPDFAYKTFAEGLDRSREN